MTNAQYRAFVLATGHEAPEDWTNATPPHGKEDHPVVHVSWHDGMAYCRWLSEVTGETYSLPSEVEWEKGARGTDGRIYPWGDQWDERQCNSKESSLYQTTSVHAYPQGASPYGLLDMAGNVWEWTRSLWGGYPYPSDAKERAQREELQAPNDQNRVLRGGTFNFPLWYARCAHRHRYVPRYQIWSLGFRVVVLSAS